MTVHSRERLILVVGDIIAFTAALWVTLLVRYAEAPSGSWFQTHIEPFAILFVVWVLVFFVAGLYGKHTMIFKNELPQTIIVAQAVNIILAALFFFFIPYFGIAPKTNLLIYLIVSSFAIVVWRLQLFPLLEYGVRQKAIIIGSGKELVEMVDEIKRNPRYRLECVEVINTQKVQNANDIQDAVLKRVVGGDVPIIIADATGPHGDMLMPLFYNLTFVRSEVQVLNFGKVYEEIFDRVALSQLSPEWLLENFDRDTHGAYDFGKRVLDVCFSFFVLCILACITPFVYLARRLEGNDPLFITQERIGKNGKKISVLKFCTMTCVENGVWLGETANRVTKVGAFLRKLSIDEMPQAVAVLKGDLSFIGPRSDMSGLAERLADAIPFYNARYKVTPGISGWAQINQRYTPGHISPQSIEESRIRLAYDLYYVKYRSFILDISIALRTIKTIIVRIFPYAN